MRAKVEFVPAEHLVEIGIGSCLQIRLGGFHSPAIPRADIEADITTKETIADSLPEFTGDSPFVLDRQVGDAFLCVELIRCSDGFSGTGVDAGSTFAAMVRLGSIRWKF